MVSGEHRPIFTVGALALAGRRANAVGAVRLTCAPEGLEIELIRVAGFATGFAPGALADPVLLRVPYVAVRGLVREGRMLYLTLDPAIVTPHHRFALARFADDPAAVLARAFQARARARWAALLLPPPLGVLAAALIPEGLAGGILGRASLGVLAALVLWALLREIEAWRTWGGPRSDRLRDALEATLAEHLGLVPPAPAPAPAPVPVPVPVPAPAPVPISAPARAALSVAPDAPDPLRRLFRPILAAVLAAVGAVAVMAFLQRYAGNRPPPPAVERASSGLAAAALGVRPDVRPAPQRARCACMRADSPLWKDGIPAVAVLTFEGDDGSPGEPSSRPDRSGSPQYGFDLAVVNDAARPFQDVRLTLTFARRNARGKRVGAVDRGLFWGGALEAGHAIKWHVKAPGSEMRIDASVSGTLEQAKLEPAPADAFFKLTSSRVRAVRLHGALMLAYLRDPRAADAARALSASGAADGELLGRIRRAAAPVIACDVRREGDRLEACVFNASSQPRSGLALRAIPDAPGAAAWSAPIEGAVPVHDGVRVAVPAPALDTDVAIADPSATE